MTKGYGLTVDDINWSCPADLEPYEKAHKIELTEHDSIAHMNYGSYALSAISTAIEHCLCGKKAKSEYIKEAVLSKIFENDGLTEDEIAEKEIRKAIQAEEEWIRAANIKNLPETVIK